MSLDEEEVKTYSELIIRIHSKLLSEMEGWVSSFRKTVEGLEVSGEKIDGAPVFDGVVGAVDGGSSIIPFADRLVGIASALSISIEADESYRRRIIEPKILLQERDEGDGEFMDRVDMERETMMMSLANKTIEDVELLMVDGPLIPRPEYIGEYLYQLRRLLEKAEGEGKLLVGFVKRPQSMFVEEFRGLGFTDRAILSSLLGKLQVYPWPPRTHEVRFFELRYTYIKLLDPPLPGVFRLDFPKHLSDEEILSIIGYVAASSDPWRGVPAIILKADEEVKMSKRLIADLYRDCFSKISSNIDPSLWSPLAPRWGELLW
jgi:hypothetical protein